MVVKRVYLRRDELQSVDTYRRSYKHISIVPNFVGCKQYHTLNLHVMTKKGNESRLVSFYPAEIEGVGNLYYFTYSDKLLRKRERLEDFSGNKYTWEPIARCKVTNNVIYSLNPEV